MTDKQYIQAFLESEQRGIRKAYMQMKKPFLAFLHFRFSGLQDTDLEDAYHEAFLRLQQNILKGRLTHLVRADDYETTRRVNTTYHNVARP